MLPVSLRFAIAAHTITQMVADRFRLEGLPGDWQVARHESRDTDMPHGLASIFYPLSKLLTDSVTTIASHCANLVGCGIGKNCIANVVYFAEPGDVIAGLGKAVASNCLRRNYNEGKWCKLRGAFEAVP